MANATPPNIKMGSPERFGYSWEISSKILDIHKDQFDQWVAALPEDQWKDVRFLDVGCGIGRNSHWAMKRGAAGGIAIDVDDRTLEQARKNLAPYPETEVRWLSVYDIPFENEFDLAFSIGVIHHLENPELAVRRMVQATKPGGKVLVWLYGRENNGWIVHLFNPVRRILFSRLPLSVVNSLAWPLTGILWIMLRLAWGNLPYHDLLRRTGFEHLKHIVLDHMIPRITLYYRKHGAEELLQQAGLSDIRSVWVNKMSWSVVGTKPSGRSHHNS